MKAKTQKIILDTVEELKKRKLTLALAESCTGGLLSSWITQLSGVSAIYRGGVVSYAGEVKVDVLHVPRELLKTHGEVSEPVAHHMATGVRKALKSDWSIAITGVAGPTGGSLEKPVGTVCFAVAGPNLVRTVKKNFAEHLKREEIQYASAEFALEWFLEIIKN